MPTLTASYSRSGHPVLTRVVARFTTPHYQSSMNFKWFSSSDNTNSTGTDNTNSPRLSVAIVGAGPSGFYAAKYLTSSVLKRIRSAESPTSFCWSGIDVDVIERLPTPYGLVRYGVAPDHPEVKNVENDYASLFEKEVARGSIESNFVENRTSSLSYFGNVDVGKDISLSQLQSLYHIVILAYGCQAADRRLGIPGEDTLEGVLSAREFVAWYNGHPDFGHIGPIVERCLRPLSSRCAEDSSDSAGSVPAGTISKARVVVVGQGNVALDVARILAKGKPGLIDTDIPESVLQILQGGVSHVSVVGRRGHVQGAFTIKELRELTKLEAEGHGTSFNVRKKELDLGMTKSSQAELGRPKTRINKLLYESAKLHGTKLNKMKQIELRFLMNPIRFKANDRQSDRIGGVICERTQLDGEPFLQRPSGTGELEIMPADLVLVSIGYRGMPLEGMGERLFDFQKGIVAHHGGKVIGENNLFVTGWIKRGPNGIVGTNIMDSKDTVCSVMKFLDQEGTQSLNAQKGEETNLTKGRAGLTSILQQNKVKAICWHQFLKIEAAESDHSRLRSHVQPREKFLSVKEMLVAAS